MKKIIIFLTVAALLALCGCAGPGTPAATPTPIAVSTAEPTPSPTPEPASVPGTVRADNVLVFYTFLSRGDTITVTGALENFYVISVDGVPMLVEKRFFRQDSQSAPDTWSGFAKAGAEIYDSAYLNESQNGKVLASLSLNDVIEVLDQFDGIAYVSCGGVTGYMELALISETETTVYSYSSGGGGSDYSGGYSGGSGSSGGSSGSSSGGSSGGQDGGDITLGFRQGEAGGIVLLSTVTGTVSEDNKALKPAAATVLTDKFPVYLCVLGRGDAVKICASEGAEWSVLYNGKTGLVSSSFLRLDSDAAYAQWSGYAKNGAALYGGHALDGEGTALQTNTAVTVLDDLGSVYVVEIASVGTGYMSHDDVSETEIVFYSYSGGDSSGGSSSGGSSGGGSSGGSSGGSEWTEPAL